MNESIRTNSRVAAGANVISVASAPPAATQSTPFVLTSKFTFS